MNKKLILLPLSIVMIFMMAGGAYAIACSFDTETTAGTRSTYVDGSGYNVSGTVTGASGGTNATVAILSINNGISTTYVFNSTSGENVSAINASVDTTELSDDFSYTFTFTLKNVSQDTLTTCTGSFISDNTAPSCTFGSGLTSSEKYAPEQKWLVTCSEANSATIQFGSNTPLAMAEASDTCSFTGDKSNVPIGAYSTLSVVTSDGLNTTGCSLNSISIDAGVPIKQVAALLATTGSKTTTSSGGGNNTLMWIVIAGAVGFWWIRRKK